MSYSVAIRTLGTSSVFRQELESLHNQTIKPDKIVIYIAEGYSRPIYTIGIEEYVWVPKGMVSQRALDYDEIESEYIFLLDDDVELAPNTVELLLKAAKDYSADCVAPDIFKNQEMPLKSKLFAAVTNLVFPRPNDQWAFKIHRNGSFSYNNNPGTGFFLSQSCAGPAWLCKKMVFQSLHLEDELWLDDLGFSFGDDALETYKIFKNGYRLGVLYGCSVSNLDAKTASASFQRNTKKFYIRSYASFVLWWRMIYDYKDYSLRNRFCNIFLFGFKAIWLFLIHLSTSFLLLNYRIPYYYLKGLMDGWNYVHSDDYKKIPSYIINKR